MKFLTALLVILAITAAPASGWAQRVGQLPTGGAIAPAVPDAAPPSAPDERIAAVVNDNIISTSDVVARLRLGLLSSGLPDNPDVRQRLLPQVLRALIDEQLQMQEAKRLDLSVPDDEVNMALARIAHDNNIQGDMKSYVAAHGVSPDALVQQIKNGLSWSKVVQRELRPRVDIGDDEIDAAIERMRANAGKEEYLVSEILLMVDSPQDEDQVKQVADNLVQQLKNGASFAAVAQQFSQGSGAAAGGDIGWIQVGQLAPELNKALEGSKANEIIGPIRTSSGYHILGIRDKRTIALGDPKDISVSLQQAFRPFDATTSKDVITQEAAQLHSSVNGCANLQSDIASRFPDWRWQNLGDVKMGKAPSWVTEKIGDVPTGGSSEPFATDKGALILFVCDKHVPEADVNREAIMNAIGSEKLELQARRLLRDLRRAAYIDVRLGQSPS